MKMRNDALVWSRPVLLACVCLASACSGQVRGSADAGAVESGAVDAATDDAPADAPEAAPPPKKCDDNSGTYVCCPSDAIGGAACHAAVACATPCRNGFRVHMYCSAGQWGSGHGLFACTGSPGDAGP